MKIFNVVIKFLNSMKFWQKFLLIGLILLVSLCIISLQHLLNSSNQMKRIEHMVNGIEYNEELKDILLYSQKVVGFTVSYTSSGDTATKDAVKGDLELANANLTAAIERINNKNINFNNGHEIEESLKQIIEKWDILQQTEWKSAVTVQQEFDIFHKSIIKLMREVANSSGLLLATSVEQDYLIQITTLELPELTEKLVQMRSIGTDMINSGVILKAQTEMINTLYYPVLDTTQQVQTEMGYVLSDEHLSSSLQQDYDAYNANIAAFMSLMTELSKQQTSIDEFLTVSTTAIDSMYTFYNTSVTTLVDTISKEYKESKNDYFLLCTMVIVILIISLLLFTGLYMSIRRSVTILEKGATEVAAGQLNTVIALHTKDEMKYIEDAFNVMTGQLNTLVSKISNSAEEVSGASEELNASAEEATASADHVAAAINQMAVNANTQVISLKESSRAMDEMAEGIQRIAENSSRVSSLTSTTMSFANDGQATVEKAINQMQLIKETVYETNKKIKQLQKQSSQISAIIEVITEISNQTNLLALNAAIEAARAGIHGKGFSVVAEEVRNLADQSKQSAKQITELIMSIQNETEHSVKLMGNVTQNVVIGIQVTEQTAQKFEHIVDSMNTLNPEMEEISSTTTQFSAQTEQVVAAMQHILNLADQTNLSTSEILVSSDEQLAVMQNVTASANGLSEMSESLRQLVASFKL